MARASRRKYHYIYRITNKLNGKFYIGMHSTDNLNDGYFGSGTYLWRSINKYGKENHDMEILEHYFSREDLVDREKELVTIELICDDLCMNLRQGGEGGWYHVNSSREEIDKRCWQWVKAHSDKMASDPTYKSKVSNSLSEAWKIRSENGEKPFGGKGNNAFLGKTHSEETKQKMRKSKNNGESNSQFGLRWIHNIELKISKKIKKVDPLPIGWKEGRKLKFTNHTN